MDRIAHLLSRGASGLYLLTGKGGPNALDRLCRLKGVLLFRIDGRRVLTKQRFLAVAGRALDFPNWFGTNWDAFEDCVTDLEWVRAPAYVVLLENMERFAERVPRDFDTALRILEAAAEFWSEEGVPFHVLVSGAQTAGAPLPGVSTL
jgi:RNAse (barnase) inhibitor barstar